MGQLHAAIDNHVDAIQLLALKHKRLVGALFDELRLSTDRGLRMLAQVAKERRLGQIPELLGHA